MLSDIYTQMGYTSSPIVVASQRMKEEVKEVEIPREVEEEIGYKTTLIQEIGIVEDYYNPIYRKNINHYYLLRSSEKSKQHFDSYGDLYIKGVVWVNIDEAIRLYENMNKDRIERLVRNRELPILKIVKDILGGKKNG